MQSSTTIWYTICTISYLPDVGEDVLVTRPEYDPDNTQLEPDDSDLNQDLLESDGMHGIYYQLMLGKMQMALTTNKQHITTRYDYNYMLNSVS